MKKSNVYIQIINDIRIVKIYQNKLGLEGSLGHLVSRLSWIFEPIFGKKNVNTSQLGGKINYLFRGAQTSIIPFWKADE